MLGLTRSRQNAQQTSGFTLIEIMIVLGIIGIIAVVGVPKFKAVQNQYRLEASAQAVIAELKYAKQLAKDTRRTTYVVLNTNNVQVMQKESDDSYKTVDSKEFDPGVTFNSGDSLNAWMDPIEESHVLLGHGLNYNSRGFVSTSGTVVLNPSSQKQVGVQIAEKTGYFSITWP